MIDFYNAQVDDYAIFCEQRGNLDRKKAANSFIDADSSRVAWSGGLKDDLARGTRIDFIPGEVVRGCYRPFQPQHVYFDRYLNERRYQLPTMFPTPRHKNLGIVLASPASHFEFTPFMTDLLPNLHLLDTAQFFPRWTYGKADPDDGGFDFGSDASTVDEHGYRRVDNITDAIAELYEQAIGAPVTKDDVFYSVYGLLHDRLPPNLRGRPAQDAPAHPHTVEPRAVRAALGRRPRPRRPARKLRLGRPLPARRATQARHRPRRPGNLARCQNEMEDQGRALDNRLQPEGHHHRDPRVSGALPARLPQVSIHGAG